MSKKNEKRKRNLEREKTHAKEAFIPIVAALFFLVLGVAGLISNSDSLNEYEKSDDIRQVEAVVTDAKISQYDAEGRMWFVHLKYDVDGTEYYDTKTIDTYDIEVGETIKTEVYKTSDGKYAISEITDSWSLTLKNVLFYISIVVGAVLMTAGVVVLMTSLKRIKELQAKIQPDDTGNPA